MSIKEPLPELSGLLASIGEGGRRGAQIGAGEGPLDFDIEDASAVDKDKLSAELQALEAHIARLFGAAP